MADRHGKVGFNHAHVKSISKETFISDFKDIFPHLNLDSEYDQIVGSDKPVKETIKKLPVKKNVKK